MWIDNQSMKQPYIEAIIIATHLVGVRLAEPTDRSDNIRRTVGVDAIDPRIRRTRADYIRPYGGDLS